MCEVAGDVLAHHDGVVDQDADRERLSASRVSTLRVKPSRFGASP
jgi:hypothetical protein